MSEQQDPNSQIQGERDESPQRRYDQAAREFAEAGEVETDHEPLRMLAEDDLIWITRFSDELRQLSPRFAEDDAGTLVDSVARSAFEEPELHALEPEAAAAQWWQGQSEEEQA